MRQGFTVHHNGPTADLIQGDMIKAHIACEKFWQAVKDWHMGHNGWSDIAYSFGICPHGIRFTGRGWDKSQFANGSDDVGEDDDVDGPWYSVLMFVGGGPGTGEPEEIPTGAMDEGLDKLIQEGRQTGRCGMRVKPHSDWKRKPCPGPHYTAYCREHDNKPYPTTPTKEWDEMATKAEIKEAMKEVLEEAFTDAPGVPGKGYALGQIFKRLNRELTTSTSNFRNNLVKLFKGGES